MQDVQLLRIPYDVLYKVKKQTKKVFRALAQHLALGEKRIKELLEFTRPHKKAIDEAPCVRYPKELSHLLVRRSLERLEQAGLIPSLIDEILGETFFDDRAAKLPESQT